MGNKRNSIDEHKHASNPTKLEKSRCFDLTCEAKQQKLELYIVQVVLCLEVVGGTKTSEFLWHFDVRLYYARRRPEAMKCSNDDEDKQI